MANNNEVRIIGGQWKGRKLKFPARPTLRPTLGRVRETLFNWIMPTLAGARCLDLYAGSGALGFEALSRGAAEVTFVERDRKAARAIETNLTTLGPLSAQAASVVADSAERFLLRAGRRYDVIFCDPPFDLMLTGEALISLLEEHLEPEGVLYLELPKRAELPQVGRRIKYATAGDCQFTLLASAENPEA
jgi:16S rRNA (guanine966-N2)-methyltransferase